MLYQIRKEKFGEECRNHGIKLETFLLSLPIGFREVALDAAASIIDKMSEGYFNSPYSRWK